MGGSRGEKTEQLIAEASSDSASEPDVHERLRELLRQSQDSTRVNAERDLSPEDFSLLKKVHNAIMEQLPNRPDLSITTQGIQIYPNGDGLIAVNRYKLFWCSWQGK